MMCHNRLKWPSFEPLKKGKRLTKLWESLILGLLVEKCGNF